MESLRTCRSTATTPFAPTARIPCAASGTSSTCPKQKSDALTELAIARADALGLTVATPREARRRGAHVAIRHPDAESLCRTLMEAHGVITDHRPPDVLRLGFAPLYTRYVDVWNAFDAIAISVRAS